MTPRLYLEAHITCDAGEDFETFLKVAEEHGWRGSRFDQDDVDCYHGKWFLSTRSTNLEAIKQEIRDTLDGLKAIEINPIRWKIEDTLLDSKYGDTL